MRTRQSVYDLEDDTLGWYSQAIELMKTRDINDPTSWWYQASIHDYDAGAPYWDGVVGNPTSATLESGYWDRCQHGTWFFLPWHRMYLHHFEEMVVSAVIELGGPSDWALPYWNYCEAYDSSVSSARRSQALRLPPEFGSHGGPAAGYQGLWIAGRNNYEIPLRNASIRNAMAETRFTNVPFDLNFGGGITAFSHFGNRQGAIELQPHNVIHMSIGGAMSTGVSPLDPIFWLHHANIDRLWQVWVDQGGRPNPSDNRWRNFSFKFHDAASTPVEMRVSEVESPSQLNYRYAPSYPSPVSIAPPHISSLMTNPLDVFGATQAPFGVSVAGASSSLEVVPQGFRNASLPPVTVLPRKKTLLHLANIKGGDGIPPVDVFINSGPNKSNDDSHLAGVIGLFGLKKASTQSVVSDGSGLSFTLDVTELVNDLRANQDWDEEDISIDLIPQGNDSKVPDFTVERISLHTEID